jgi:kumamolisin
MTHVPLKGSERVALPGARVVGPANPTERLEVSVLVRRRARTELDARVAAIASRDRSVRRLSRDAFAKKHAASSVDLSAVRRFARTRGLAIAHTDAVRRTVILSGTVAQFEAAFSVQLQLFEHPSGTYRGRIGAVHIPAELDGVIEAVLGLDNRPQARPHFRLRSAHAPHAGATPISFTPPQVASLYGFPSGQGTGQCVALIELGGGFRPADLATYFNGLGVGLPKVTAVSVDHAANNPTGSANGPDGEVMLDIEVVGGVAPGADIVVYFGPNTDAGFLDAVTTAIHDTQNRPSVISISWGESESTWTAQAMQAMDSAFQSAVALGISVCVAAGDSGSSDGVSDGQDHVDFPASSPHVLSCGGTTLRGSAQSIASEVVWNDGAAGGATGGGVSSVFARPTWQSSITSVERQGKPTALTQRGVPDVAGDADPETGYDVRIDGTNSVIGGTSAVAPLWAGLIAVINQSTGKSAGFINPQLYQSPGSLRDITQGNNGDYDATVGWDACTGLGSPNGAKLVEVL